MKIMNKIVSMLLVLSLMVCICPFAAAQDASAENVDYEGFHAPTIRKMIEVNLDNGSVDEEFFHLLANAYLADPELLIETIVDLPQEDIAYLAKAISYDLQKTQRQTLATEPVCSDDPVLGAIGKLIVAESAKAENGSLDGFVDESILADETVSEIPDAEQLATEELYNIQFSLSTNATEVLGSRVTASLTFNSTLVATTTRTYSIKFYKKVGNEVSQCGLALATISPDNARATASMRLIFNATGNYEVYAKIYNESGTLLDTSPSATITVSGQWQITVELTADRTQLGTIMLYDASGTEVSHSVCLGRSEYNYPMNQTDGHTPIGVYVGELDGTRSNTTSYGPHQVIKLTGQSGYVVEECSHRWGLLIHGGQESFYAGLEENDPNFKLCPTHGCVRVTSEYQLQLENEIEELLTNFHYDEGIVTITQDGQTTLTED